MLDVGEFAPQGRQFLSHILPHLSVSCSRKSRASRCPGLTGCFKFIFRVHFRSHCHSDIDLKINYARICKESFGGDASNSVAETHVAILSQCHRSIEVAVVTAIADLLLYYVPLRQDFVSLCLVSPKLFG